MSTEALHKNIGIGTMPIHMEPDGRIVLLDQRMLPRESTFFDATDLDRMCFAISTMVVRGAPSIGVAAAFGLAAHAKRVAGDSRVDSRAFLEALREGKEQLDATRPTAVNLSWGTAQILDRAKSLLKNEPDMTPDSVASQLLNLAKLILEDHVRINKTLSEHGVKEVRPGYRIMTHCNAGSLAACGWGTALGVIRSAHLNGLSPKVFVNETRPRNQGSKLTMWELAHDGIPSTLVCDSMAGHLMSRDEVDMVVVGADRIATNGDTANKIGTYSLAVLASYHKVPFYIAAPLSTFDRHLASGKEIPIEYRDEKEVTFLGETSITVQGARAVNPAFDVTPAALIAGIITEVGVLRPDYTDSIAHALATETAGL